VDFGLGMNPEFLREGEAVEDFMHPDRIVIGGSDARVREILADVYSVFDGADLLATSNRTAEMIKYTSNSLLATLISFSNEVGNLCAALGGIDVVEVMEGVHLDRRLSPTLADGRRIVPGVTTYLQAGCGFGGSCFPKDVNALIAHGRRAGVPMAILDAVMEVNRRQPYQVLQLLRRHFSSLRGVRVAVLGLAFKPGTDDVRESPSIPIIRELIDEGAHVEAYDPVVRRPAVEWVGSGSVTLHDSLSDAIEDAEAIVLLTRWNEFAQLPELLSGRPLKPLVVDGRRMLDHRKIERYEGIGV
jgi:UDPglucose 6-dehydrogenase/GDP-mannose 6-dehydrogenase